MDVEKNSLPYLWAPFKPPDQNPSQHRGHGTRERYQQKPSSGRSCQQSTLSPCHVPGDNCFKQAENRLHQCGAGYLFYTWLQNPVSFLLNNSIKTNMSWEEHEVFKTTSAQNNTHSIVSKLWHCKIGLPPQCPRWNGQVPQRPLLPASSLLPLHCPHTGASHFQSIDHA